MAVDEQFKNNYATTPFNQTSVHTAQSLSHFSNDHSKYQRSSSLHLSLKVAQKHFAKKKKMKEIFLMMSPASATLIGRVKEKRRKMPSAISKFVYSTFAKKRHLTLRFGSFAEGIFFNDDEKTIRKLRSLSPLGFGAWRALRSFPKLKHFGQLSVITNWRTQSWNLCLFYGFSLGHHRD